MGLLALSAANATAIVISFAVALLIVAGVVFVVWRLWQGPFHSPSEEE
jgi:hypothetical protein